MKINYDELPLHLRGGMWRYLENGILPGGFLQAVLSGDMQMAKSKADMASLMRLTDIFEWCDKYVPEDARGSRDAMEKWMAKF